MLQALGIVDACFEDDVSRLRAQRRIGGKTLLEYVARQATDSQRLDGVVIVVNGDPANAFVSYCTPLDVPLFVGKSRDRLTCWAAATEAYSTKAVVRIPVDSPFVDPEAIDRLVRGAESSETDCDFFAFSSEGDEYSDVEVPAVQWFRAKALRRAARKATKRAHRTSPAHYFLDRAMQDRHVGFLPVPAVVRERQLRLEGDEDWECVLTLLDTTEYEEIDTRHFLGLMPARSEQAFRSRPK